MSLLAVRGGSSMCVAEEWLVSLVLVADEVLWVWLECTVLSM